jgi:hypothetical protein
MALPEILTVRPFDSPVARAQRSRRTAPESPPGTVEEPSQHLGGVDSDDAAQCATADATAAY